MTVESILLWRLRGQTGRHAECHLATLCGDVYQLTVLYNGLETTTEMYSTAAQARARAKQLVEVLRATGWCPIMVAATSSDPW